mmetsp:Transcript_4578/g.12272  ORF Transcript_4578/g.12272 Transcript_4578/m.12272 type:complete len:202 (+) Transcript_4578:65-670(+)
MPSGALKSRQKALSSILPCWKIASSGASEQASWKFFADAITRRSSNSKVNDWPRPSHSGSLVVSRLSTPTPHARSSWPAQVPRAPCSLLRGSATSMHLAEPPPTVSRKCRTSASCRRSRRGERTPPRGEPAGASCTSNHCDLSWLQVSVNAGEDISSEPFSQGSLTKISALGSVRLNQALISRSPLLVNSRYLRLPSDRAT